MMRPTMTTLAVLAVAVLSTAAIAQGVDTGNADFSKFVAIGDSLVAGESNGSLTEVFQVNSVPALIYKQTHGGDGSGFEQPLFSDPGDQGRLVLGPGGVPVRVPGTGVPLNGTLNRPYDNMGLVGGARVLDLLVIGDLDSCSQVPYHDPESCARLNETLRDSGPALQQTVSLDPSFVLLWIGGNDALQAAASGVMALLTPNSIFDESYSAVIDGLTESASRGMALATVPNVTSIPLMTTIPWFVLNYQTQEPVLVGGNVVPLIGPLSVPTAPGDLVSLPALEWLLQGCGVPPALDQEAGITRNPSVCPADAPLPLYVLKSADAVTVQDTIDGYNTTIREVAQTNGYALFDAAAFLDQVSQNGYTLGGIDYGTEFLTGGLFSYDGFHPAPITMALAANEFIKAINLTYRANIPQVDLYGFVFGPEGNLSPPLPAPPGLTTSMGRHAREAAAIPSLDDMVKAGLIDAPGTVRRFNRAGGLGTNRDPGATSGKHPARRDDRRERNRRR